MQPTDFIYSDGGREAAGFKGDAGDCVTRAIAIATGTEYREVYETLAEFNRAITGKSRSARNGVPRDVYDAYLELIGWRWTPTMYIGSGVLVHLRRDELPAGPLIARLSKHLAAVIDGTVYDTHDPARNGTRAVYGYWQPATEEAAMITCDYCGHEADYGELEARPRGTGFRCKDATACDRRDAENARQRKAELRRLRRAGEELSEAEAQELSE